MNSVFLKATRDYNQDDVDISAEYILHNCGLDDIAEKKSDPVVVLKVNLLMKSRPDSAVTTHPAVVSAVIKSLKAHGIKNIIIADSSAGLFTASRLKGIYEGCGMSELVQDGVTLNYDLAGVVCKTQFEQNREFNILRAVKEADIVIGIGKLKTHVMTGISGSVKNYFGVIPGLEKTELHCRFPDKANFCDMICNLYETLAPDISILDAIVGMEGNGPSGGKPRKFGFIIGGRNGHYVDRAACYLIGAAPKSAYTVQRAIERGLVPEDIKDIDVQGDIALLANPLNDLALPETQSAELAVVLPKFLRPAGSKVLNKLLLSTPSICKADCVGCGRCAEACPQKVILIKNNIARIKTKSCIRCFCCHEVCPERAVEIKQSIVVKAVN